MIPYARQDINRDDIDAVVAVLRSDFLTQGPSVSAFEQFVSNYCGAQHAVAVNSATSALHIACLALGVGKGDVVWTTPITFVASANCALYCGATVDFVDIDSRTYNLSADRLAEKLATRKRLEPYPRSSSPFIFVANLVTWRASTPLAVNTGSRLLKTHRTLLAENTRVNPSATVVTVT